MMNTTKWGFVAGLVLALAPLGCAVDGTEDDPGLEETEATSWFTGDPVVFVHGCTTPDATDAQAITLWDTMVNYFSARGYPSSYLVRFLNDGAQCTSNIFLADQLDDVIDQVRAATGKSQVDIVAHSMGALTTRYYFYLEGTAKVKDFVSLGGANHGVDPIAIPIEEALGAQDAFGGYPWFEGFQEMYPPYACRGEAYQGSADIQYRVNGCLTSSGRTVYKDETPGSVRYVSVRNAQDEIADPVETACLNQQRQNDCSDTAVNKLVSVPPGVGPGICAEGCPAHLTMLFDSNVVARTFNFVRGGSW